MDSSIKVQELDHVARALREGNQVDLTLREHTILDYYMKTKNPEVVDLRDPKNAVFCNHTVHNCPMTNILECPLHRIHAMYCMARHERNDDICSCCRIFFSNKDLLAEFSENRDIYKRHISKCGVKCWKCVPNIDPKLDRGFMQDMQLQSEYDTLLKIPNGLFYSQKENKDNMGYLRIIPVSFENDVADCEDYKSLIEEMQRDNQYVTMRNVDHGRISEMEKVYRTIVTDGEIREIIQSAGLYTNLTMSSSCVERLSLALKEYLTYVLGVCKQEHEQVAMITESSSEVITGEDVQRAIQFHPFIRCSYSSLCLVCCNCYFS